jgi:hypothetical protein
MLDGSGEQAERTCLFEGFTAKEGDSFDIG